MSRTVAMNAHGWPSGFRMSDALSSTTVARAVAAEQFILDVAHAAGLQRPLCVFKRAGAVFGRHEVKGVESKQLVCRLEPVLDEPPVR